MKLLNLKVHELFSYQFLYSLNRQAYWEPQWQSEAVLFMKQQNKAINNVQHTLEYRSAISCRIYLLALIIMFCYSVSLKVSKHQGRP